jgi:uncharacterized protein YbjT (DUF2867 family)
MPDQRDPLIMLLSTSEPRQEVLVTRNKSLTLFVARPVNTILLIGGTGKVGSRLAEILRNAGAEVRIASRSGGDVRFDWRNTDTYASAVRGIDGAFIVGPGSATDWSPSLTEFLGVAAGAGVRQVALLSARGVEFLDDGAVARSELALMAGPIDWTILRPSHFAQNFTEAMFIPVAGEITAPVGTGAEPFVDVRDIAEVAAAVLLTDEYAGQVIEISGPRAVSFDEAAQILAAEIAQPVAFRDESVVAHVERLRAANTPEGYIVWRMAMLGGIRSGDDAYVSDGVNRVLGRPATSFEDWARREAGVLAG